MLGELCVGKWFHARLAKFMKKGSNISGDGKSVDSVASTEHLCALFYCVC